MVDYLNVGTNLNRRNTGDEFKEESQADVMLFHEEISIMKTEVKEEIFDFENPVDDVEYLNVKEEYNALVENSFETEDLEIVNDREQSLNENHVSGNCKLKDQDLQKKQKLSKKRLHLNLNKAEKRNSLKRRILVKQDGESKNYRCGDCKYVTHLKQNLRRHVRVHTNDRPFKCTYKNCTCIAGQEKSCKCSMCGYATLQKGCLELHILTKHSGKPKKYKCADCKYATHQKLHLERHIRIHTNDRPFKCTYTNCKCIAGQEEFCKCSMCGYAAAQKGHLKEHVLRKHSTEPKKFKCANCNYATHRKFELEQHMRIHTNKRPFKCMYKNCECTAGQEESCKCSMCGYAAKQVHGLKVHILLKHSGKPKKYKCAHCNYAAHLKHDLKQHIRTHTRKQVL